MYISMWILLSNNELKFELCYKLNRCFTCKISHRPEVYHVIFWPIYLAHLRPFRIYFMSYSSEYLYIDFFQPWIIYVPDINSWIRGNLTRFSPAWCNIVQHLPFFFNYYKYAFKYIELLVLWWSVVHHFNAI